MVENLNKKNSIIFSWLRLVFSLRGIWCFIPGILGVLFVYWADANGYQTFILKGHHEIIAIVLIGGATALFLLRAVCYRMEIDFILAAMSTNFLCREIHFVGTDNGVVIVAAFVLIWLLIRKNRIWASIEQAKLFQVSLAGTAFTYLLSILIARRVFSINHLALLPNEANVHIALEEVLENIAHLFLIFCGIVAFYSVYSQYPKPAKCDKKIDRKALEH